MSEPSAAEDRVRTLRDLAADLGVAASEIDHAEADGTLPLLVVERLVVGEPGIFTQDDVIARSGLGEDARKFWRALGFPDPEPDERTFSSVDLEMLQMVDAMIRLELIEREGALQLARVIGTSMQRIAQAQIDAIAARLDAEGPDADPEQAMRRAETLLPTMPRVLEYAWRRHMQGAVRRRVVREHLADDGPAPRAVGFADLVGFTTLSQELDDRELAEVVDRFETTAFDLVTGHGGRVVKMIGDEVMFEVADLTDAALLSLDLADAFHLDDSVNDIRVGLAYGPALAREGDLFGPTVNLAARLVSIAYAGAVVTSTEVRDALEGDERFAFKSLRPRYLKNIGRVQLVALRRSGDTSEGIAERARRRRRVFGERLAALASQPDDGGDRTTA
jgi:adenylate cyclase